MPSCDPLKKRILLRPKVANVPEDYTSYGLSVSLRGCNRILQATDQAIGVAGAVDTGRVALRDPVPEQLNSYSSGSAREAPAKQDLLLLSGQITT
jgi:hypothetical protein